SVDKMQYSSSLAAALSYLLLRQRDSVGLVTFSERLDCYIPARSGPRHLQVLLHAIDRIRPGGKTDLAQTFHMLAQRLRRRGLVIVISDLLDDKERVLPALRHLRHGKHEVIVFHILDPNELAFRFSGPLVLEDLETRRKLVLDPRLVRNHYQQSLKSFLEDFRRRCGDSRIDYHPITTNLPFDRALLAYLEKRSRLA
ncbi:MAG: VWA domain-containing protein, partial [candidate division WOR-3 bacterium]